MAAKVLVARRVPALSNVELAPIVRLREAVRRGKCVRDKNPDSWFEPVRAPVGASAAKRRALEAMHARELCAECPVISECLELALRAFELYGVWGGLAEWERRDMIATARRRREVAADEQKATEAVA